MRFGILNREEEIALARGKVPEFTELRVGVVRRVPPETAELEGLAIWVLGSLGIVNGAGPDHPAVTILLELVRKRKEGKGITGSELTIITKIGKTQTYYWLNRMKDAGLVGQGKKKLIEHGAIRIMSGFYLKGPNLSYTIADIKKLVDESFDDIIGVSEKLQESLKQAESLSEEAVAVSESELAPVAGEEEAIEGETIEEEVTPIGEEITPSKETIPQPDSTPQPRQSRTSEVPE